MAKKFIVGIVMGSDSDLPVMQEAAKALEEFGISSEVTAISAHRAPDRLYAYAKGAAGRGMKVLIAGAGGAAHLPGIVAALTPLPVIGVPIKSSTAAGIDSLFSIAQMPPGVPVAAVAINGAKNAGLLAVRLLALHDAKLRKKLERYQRGLAKDVLAKAKKMERMGFRKYLKDNKLS